MEFLVVDLEISPVGKIRRFALLTLAQIRQQLVRLDSHETDVATVAVRIVVDSLMLAQMFGREESFVAIMFWARERLGTQVHSNNVTLQRVLLSECLVTIAETTTTESLVTLMHCQVVLESSTGREALVATFPSASVISDLGMSALDMMLEVAVAQVSLRASCVRTLKSSVIGMRSEVLF